MSWIDDQIIKPDEQASKMSREYLEENEMEAGFEKSLSHVAVRAASIRLRICVVAANEWTGGFCTLGESGSVPHANF
jgi:hypothetical protein